ncbi:MAG: hypothetical protein K2O64_06490, partial [Lactobacillus sp.]|nr:hypothetical protein [Lactobacillus sp.]
LARGLADAYQRQILSLAQSRFSRITFISSIYKNLHKKEPSIPKLGRIGSVTTSRYHPSSA